MSKFDEILNSSDASDALLGEQIDKKVDRTEFEDKQWKYRDVIVDVSATSTLTDIDFSKYSEVLIMAIQNSTTALYTSVFPAYMVNSGYNCRITTEDASKYVNVKYSSGSTVITLPSNINNVRILAH